MMAPDRTWWPSKHSTPRRCAAESRPFRVEPPPLVLDTSAPSGDPRHLDGGVVLAMAPTAAGPGLVLVGEAADLRALGLAHDGGGHRGAGQLVRGGGDGVPVDHQQQGEGDLGADVDAEALDVQTAALGHPLLLATGADDCVHGLQLYRSSGKSPSWKRIPRPSHVGHGEDSDSTRPSPMRLRVISTSPSSEMSNTWVRVLSRASASRNTRTTSSRFLRISMSMKSMTMMPPMSRSRS